MVSSKKDDFADDGSIEGSDQESQSPHDVADACDSDLESSGPVDAPASRRNAGREIGLAERLRDIFRDEGEGDMLFHQSDKEEEGVLQWLQALDLQVIGACRADERLKPLLKLNVSSSVAEDRLLAHLSQHFEAPEVGMLARCLFIPLVSIRVGKVIKKGNLLCPTSTRGNLNLTLLPSSDLRISFVGDDGCIEKLSVLDSDSESSAVTIEEICADCSGRSFLMKFPGGRISYFWRSEKSKLLGTELLAKMKDLLGKKPSLSQLTGISESRLNRFATHLRAYFLGPGSAIQPMPNVLSAPLHSDVMKSHSVTEPLIPCSKPSRPRAAANQLSKSHASQVSLSPRLNTFKDGPSRSSCFIRSGAREKFKRRGDGSCSNILEVDNATVGSTSAVSATQSLSGQAEDEKLSEGGSCCNSLLLSLPETIPFNPLSITPYSSHAPPTKVPTSSPLFSPYYCWCPPCPSSLQYTVAPHLPPSSSSSSISCPFAGLLSLPPLSSSLSAARSPSSLPNPPLNLDDVPSLDLPAFLPDPLANIPLPVSSFVAVPSSQQISTFTPFISDPIVHIPVIDVCSSGQGYLVSAGPAISTTIAPLLPNLVNPLIPETESVVEKSARETLRLLIGSTQTNSTLMEMLPTTLTTTNESLSFIHAKKQSALVAGSRGLYSGTLDIDAAVNGISARVVSAGGGDFEGCLEQNDNDKLEKNREEPTSCNQLPGKVAKTDI